MGRKASGLGKDGRVALNRAIRPFYFDWTPNTFSPVMYPAKGNRKMAGIMGKGGISLYRVESCQIIKTIAHEMKSLGTVGNDFSGMSCTQAGSGYAEETCSAFST